MDRLLALEHRCDERRRVGLFEDLGTVDPVDHHRRLAVAERMLALQPRDPSLREPAGAFDRTSSPTGRSNGPSSARGCR